MNKFAGFICFVGLLCLGAIMAESSLAASVGDFLPMTPIQEEKPDVKKAPVKKQPDKPRPAAAKGATPQKQGARTENWTGEYNSDNSDEYADGRIEVRPKGNDYLVKMSFDFGRAMNRCFLNLTGAIGKVENGQLCIYNGKKKVFTLLRQGGKFKLRVTPNMTEKDLFTSREMMSPPRGKNGEPYVEKMKLDNKKRDDYLDLQDTFKVWKKSSLP